MSLLLLFNGARTWTASYAEAVSLGDRVGKQSSRTVADAGISIADGLAKTAGKAVSESFSLADLFARQLKRMLLESVAISDWIAKQCSRTFAESAISIADLLAKTAGKAFKETVSVLDTLQRILDRPHTFIAQAWARLVAATTNLRRWASDDPQRLWSANELMIYADPKDPESVEDFQIDWSAAAPDDAITASTWELPNDDLTIVSSSFTGQFAIVRLSGGVAGQQYSLKNVVTCASGQIRAQALLLPVSV